MNAAYTFNRRRTYARRYPNAAKVDYFWNRLADKLICAASCLSILTIFFFLFTM